MPKRCTSALRAPVGARRMHFIDIENLVGTGLPGESGVSAVRRAYELVVGGTTGELVTVACNHKAAAVVGFTMGLSGAQLQRGSGPDGADLALLAVIRREVLMGRVSRLVIGSGDAIFARELGDLRHMIDELDVVARVGGIGAELYRFADRVHLIEPSGAEFAVHLEVAA